MWRATRRWGPHPLPAWRARLLVTQGGHGGLLVTTGRRRTRPRSSATCRPDRAGGGPDRRRRYLPRGAARGAGPPECGRVAWSLARPRPPVRCGGGLAGRGGRRSGRASRTGARCSSGARGNVSAARSCPACRPRWAWRIRASRVAGGARLFPSIRRASRREFPPALPQMCLQTTSARRTGRCSSLERDAATLIRIASRPSRAVQGLRVSPRTTCRNASSSAR